MASTGMTPYENFPIQCMYVAKFWELRFEVSTPEVEDTHDVAIGWEKKKKREATIDTKE